MPGVPLCPPPDQGHHQHIYNGPFTGSQLWKTGSKEYEKVLSTYNKSVKIMYDLMGTHMYLIEPLTGSQHVRRILVRRYMPFIEKIEKSSKSSLKHLLEKDVRQTTGDYGQEYHCRIE